MAGPLVVRRPSRDASPRRGSPETKNGEPADWRRIPMAFADSTRALPEPSGRPRAVPQDSFRHGAGLLPARTRSRRSDSGWRRPARSCARGAARVTVIGLVVTRGRTRRGSLTRRPRSPRTTRARSSHPGAAKLHEERVGRQRRDQITRRASGLKFYLRSLEMRVERSFALFEQSPLVGAALLTTMLKDQGRGMGPPVPADDEPLRRLSSDRLPRRLGGQARTSGGA